MKALAVVGSDVANFECPRCGAHDRERHLFLYLRTIGLLDGLRGMSVLHFAPERQLSRVLASSGLRRYVKCDLHPADGSVQQVNLLQMPFRPGEFDVLIANHVLEHVDDYQRALMEISRVLKPGGLAILQTPYSSMLNCTWEDPGINDDYSRLLAFGQEDHLRLFGKDIFRLFENFWLRSDIRTHAEALPDIDSRKVGVNPEEPLFLFHRARNEVHEQPTGDPAKSTGFLAI